MSTRNIFLTPKIAKISGAHSLACFGEDHPCARRHGHTWWARATFYGTPDKSGILIGYEVVPEVIRAEFDHYDLDVVMAPRMATGENILCTLVDRFEAKCTEQGSLVILVRVQLWEDPIPGDGHLLEWVLAGWEGRVPK